MSDNPFAEPDDSDRTIIRGPVRATQPTPAAAPAAVPPRPAAAPFAPMAGEAEALPRVGMGRLTAAAGPLLDLLSRLAGDVAANPAELGASAKHAMQVFEAEAHAAGAGADVVEEARYALAAAIDDVASATHWGQGGVWSAYSLSAALFRDVKSGERFFQRLEAMQRNPGHYREALEVAYLCLALGMQGRYRLERNGRAELDRIREGLYQLLARARGAWERDLSPHWRGVDAPHRPGQGGIPGWAAAALAVFLVGVGYSGVSSSLASRTDDLFARLNALPPGAPPAIERVASPRPPAPPPPAPPPELIVRMRQFLVPEIEQGLVTVISDPNRVVVRIRNRGMFTSGSATVDQRFVSLLTRIGEALRSEPGGVLVIGHSDNQPIRTARFPSNYHLSAARAQAAAILIATAEGGTPGRFIAEGRGESEPLVANDTPEGRETNRRIEVVIARGARP